jgi:hypothetical protein
MMWARTSKYAAPAGISEENLAPDSGNYAMRVVYILGSISAGVSRTVKFNIGRT